MATAPVRSLLQQGLFKGCSFLQGTSTSCIVAPPQAAEESAPAFGTLLPSLFTDLGVCREFFLTLSPLLQMLNSYFLLFLNYVIAETLPTSLVYSALDCDRFAMAFWSQLNQAQTNMGAAPAFFLQKPLLQPPFPLSLAT